MASGGGGGGGGGVIEILHYFIDDMTDMMSHNTELLFGSPQR